MRILIVEDEFYSRKLLMKHLSRYATADVAIDGEEAIEAYSMALKEGHPYDLICLDVMLPKIDGTVVLEHIRKVELELNIIERLRTKILMTTGVADEQMVLKILKSGCDGYLLKPFKKERLEKELNRLGFLIGG